ncbi:MAG: HAD-IIIA family hydrolase [Anaerolineaceae bacterium]
MQRNIQYVLFDLGNTLLRYDAPWPGSLEEAISALTNYLVENGIVQQADEFHNAFRAKLEQYYTGRDEDNTEYTSLDSLNDLLHEFGIDHVSFLHLRGALDAMYAVSQSYWDAEDDAVSTLKQLQASGYRLGLVTNASDSADVNTLVDKAKIRSFFDVIAISADVGLRKPHPRMFSTALDFWKADPSQAVMIGDLLSADILGANQYGIASIWITRRASKSANQPFMDSVKPDAVVERLEEIPPLLSTWKMGLQ